MGGSGSGPRRKSNAKDTRNHHGPLGRGLKTNPPAGIPDCPFQLSKSARKNWDRLVPILSMLKTLTLVDGPALAAYCLAADRSDQADARIEKYGIIVDGKQNPAIAVRSAAQREMRSEEHTSELQSRH